MDQLRRAPDGRPSIISREETGSAVFARSSPTVTGAPADQPPILEVVNLSFRYPDGTWALRDLTLAVPTGRRVVLLGANGCGKTTLFLHFNGILRPTAGSVRFLGQLIRYDRAGLTELRSQVGMVFQDPDAQLFAASVRQDISFGPMNLGWPVELVRARVEAVIDETQIRDFADKPTHLLSYGQKKRVAIAGVLVMQPKVIIADEPTAGLDVEMTARLVALLNRLHANGTTIVISTHDVDFAYAWADHVILMKNGRLLAAGAPAAIFADADLLRSASLAPPLLVQTYLALQRRGLAPSGVDLPRSPDDLARAVADAVRARELAR